MLEQAIGHPSGIHGHFLSHRIPAVTLSYSSLRLFDSKFGRCVEGFFIDSDKYIHLMF